MPNPSNSTAAAATVDMSFFDQFDPPVTGWKVYAHGAMYSSASHNEAEVPPNGVQYVIYYQTAPFKTACYGRDEYILPQGTILKGAQISDAAFQAISQQAIAEIDIWPGA